MTERRERACASVRVLFVHSCVVFVLSLLREVHVALAMGGDVVEAHEVVVARGERHFLECLGRVVEPLEERGQLRHLE